MIDRKPIAIIAGARTPFTQAFTVMKEVPATDLGQAVLLGTLHRAACETDQVDEVVFGNVAGPPESANIARVISLQAGIPHQRVAHTVNRNCASGMESLLSGWNAIDQGRATCVIAGGTESMSRIPLMWSRQAAAVWLRLARSKTLAARLRTLASFRPRHFKPVSGIELGLTDPVSGLKMGETAEVLAKEFGISRDDQDRFAMESHHKAVAAQEANFFSGEITPEIISVQTPGGKRIEKDNGPRPGQSLPQLAKLRPLFDRVVNDGVPRGTVTAGNSCPLSDGAAAVMLGSPDDLHRFASPPLGYITSYALAGCDPRRMGLGPVYAVAQLLKQTGMTMKDFDLIELNEAFAAQVLACEKAFESKRFAQRELGRTSALGEIPRDRLNVHGGAIALGHPVGATGTRLVLTLLRSLQASGKQRGLATLCVGGGQGVAMMVETQRSPPRKMTLK